MSKRFFGSWKTWEKLVFILGCAIVATVLLGCAKLAYTHWRLRKYAAIEKEKKEQAIHRQMSQRGRRRHQTVDDVPFGIRALESGLQVEGVWISHSNTPEPASRETSAPSSICVYIPATNLSQDLEKQSPNRVHERSVSDLARDTPERDRFSLKRTSLPERPNTRQDGRVAVVDASVSKPSRSRHPPVSYSRYEGNPYTLRRQSSASSTLQGLEAIHRASTSIHNPQDSSSAENSDSSNSSAGDIEPISASAPDLLAGPRSKPRQLSSSSSNLELLDNHRMSQAAETGQFTPRGRKPGKACSDDFTRSSRGSTSVERSNHLVSRPKALSYLHDKDTVTSAPSTPKVDTRSSTLRPTSMPDPIPFTQFCKMAPPSPPLYRRRPGSPDRPRGTSSTTGVVSPFDTAPSSPIMPASEDAAALKLPPPVRTSFEKHAPHIVRGHGTGFEILKSGSLVPATPSELLKEKSKPAPPISLYNGARPRSSSVESRRKLGKKRTPSMNSFASSKEYRRSRTSLLL